MTKTFSTNIRFDPLSWYADDKPKRALWLNISAQPNPKQIIEVTDEIKADQAYRLMSEGTSLVWRSDYQNAKMLLQAINRRLESRKRVIPDALSERFHFQRQQTIQRQRILSKLLIPLNSEFECLLRRAPDTRLIFENLLSIKQPLESEVVIALRDLLGLIGAEQWYQKGLYIEALSTTITPFYGVFSPTRHEYLSLLKHVELNKTSLTAYDVGTGTGVLALMLAQQGVDTIYATDINDHALQCAQFNSEKLGFTQQIITQSAHLFPEDGPKADIILCNPPWMPVKPITALDHGVYDDKHNMLIELLDKAGDYLMDDGLLYIIMSNLAELLGLRSSDFLPSLYEEKGFKIVNKWDTLPKHNKARREDDLLCEARRQEVVSLWCLKKN